MENCKFYLFHKNSTIHALGHYAQHFLGPTSFKRYLNIQIGPKIQSMKPSILELNKTKQLIRY